MLEKVSVSATEILVGVVLISAFRICFVSIKPAHAPALVHGAKRVQKKKIESATLGIKLKASCILFKQFNLTRQLSQSVLPT